MNLQNFKDISCVNCLYPVVIYNKLSSMFQAPSSMKSEKLAQAYLPETNKCSHESLGVFFKKTFDGNSKFTITL